jgi:hypothetical protein
MLGWFLAAPAVIGAVGPAAASQPIPYAIVGCASHGAFHAPGQTNDGAVLPPVKTLEGRILDGKTLRIEGFLSPGDRFSAQAVFIVDNRCREDLIGGYRLCDPCGTMPGMPTGMLPPQPGTKVNLPAEVLRQFDHPPIRRSPP